MERLLHYTPEIASVSEPNMKTVKSTGNKGTWLRRRSTVRQGAAGQSLVELALVLPILLLLMIGIIEVGRFAYYSILVSNAARAGAQYGAQGLVNAADAAGIQTAAANDGQNLPEL